MTSTDLLGALQHTSGPPSRHRSTLQLLSPSRKREPCMPRRRSIVPRTVSLQEGVGSSSSSWKHRKSESRDMFAVRCSVLTVYSILLLNLCPQQGRTCGDITRRRPLVGVSQEKHVQALQAHRSVVVIPSVRSTRSATHGTCPRHQAVRQHVDPPPPGLSPLPELPK